MTISIGFCACCWSHLGSLAGCQLTATPSLSDLALGLSAQLSREPAAVIAHRG
jgi:hypothetical protein